MAIKRNGLARISGLDQEKMFLPAHFDPRIDLLGILISDYAHEQGRAAKRLPIMDIAQ